MFRLVSAVLRFCEVEQRAISADLIPHLSPQVASSAMWFLQRFVKTYLLHKEDLYNEVNHSTLSTAVSSQSNKCHKILFSFII